MEGSATLAIVLSSACIKVATMAQAVTMPRWDTAGFLDAYVAAGMDMTRLYGLPRTRRTPSPRQTRVFPGLAIMSRFKSETCDLDWGEGAGRAGLERGGHRRTRHQNSSDSERRCAVSMSTVTLMPARRIGSSGLRSTRTRTGMRCTTLTQLPLAFCGGRIENSAPLAGLMLSTEPDHVRFG